MRNILFLILDLILIFFAFFLSLYFSIEDVASRYEIIKLYSIYYLIFLSFYLIFNFWYKNHHVLYNFFSTRDLVELLKTVILTNLIFIIIIFFYDRLENIPRLNLIFNLTFTVLSLTIIRLVARFFYFNKFTKSKNRKKIVIIGKEIDCYKFIKFNENENDIEIVGLILTEKIIKGTIRGITILGDINNLKNLITVKKFQIDEILIGADIKQEKLSDIYFFTKNANINIYQIKFDSKNSNQNIGFKKIKIENFLARPVQLNENNNLYDYFNEKKILLTGCGGSIGSELVNEVLKYNPKLVLGLDINEENIFEVNQKILNNKKRNKCEFYVCDIKNKEKLSFLSKKFKPEIIIHAAALKHVSISEINQDEVINTNIFGTLNVLDIVKENDFINHFILVSTDKAVNPTSIMGMTKYIAENLTRSYASKLKLNKFTIVRFGNVLASSGSVVPIFEKQIKQNRPVTVSHPEVNRFFMLIHEACSLILLSAAYHKKKIENYSIKTFMLDMGKPVKIIDLAKKMIKLNNNNQIDIKIKITGLNEGEKISEELCYKFEKPKKISELPIFELGHTSIFKNFEDDVTDLRNYLKNILQDKNELKKKCNQICEKMINNNEF